MTDIITTADKIKCAKRELAMREHVYPRLVAAGKMSEGQKEHEIACMRAIAADYEALAREGG